LDEPCCVLLMSVVSLDKVRMVMLTSVVLLDGA
jgi:hypothetical protein